MRSLFRPAACVLAALALAGPARAQTETVLYDHVHMSVADPQAAAQWYHDNVGGEWVDGRTDRLLFGTTRIMFLPGGGDRKPSAGSVFDHLGFSFPDLAAELSKVEAAGATITTPMREVEGLFPLAFVNDPFGTRLEMIQDPQHLGFHHVHLRSPDPEATLQWYYEKFGGVRLKLRGRLDGILYPGNVWILAQRGDAFPSSEGTIDHIGWRSPETDAKLADLTSRGVELLSQPRGMTLPNGTIRFFYVSGPDGARIEFVERQADMR